MLVQNLIQKLTFFDGEHPVVVAISGEPRDKQIIRVEYDNCKCVIYVED